MSQPVRIHRPVNRLGESLGAAGGRTVESAVHHAQEGIDQVVSNTDRVGTLIGELAVVARSACGQADIAKVRLLTDTIIQEGEALALPELSICARSLSVLLGAASEGTPLEPIIEAHVTAMQSCLGTRTNGAT